MFYAFQNNNIFTIIISKVPIVHHSLNGAENFLKSH